MDRTQLIKLVNEAIGKEAFERYDKLPFPVRHEFELLLTEGQIDMHHDGYLGFTTDTPQGWTSECFKA